MANNPSRRLYALVFSPNAATPADYASLHAAGALARQAQTSAHALMVISGEDTEAAIQEARAAQVDAITLIHQPDNGLQPQQLTDLFAALITEAANPLAQSLFLVSPGTAAEEAAGALAARIGAVPLGRPARMDASAEHGWKITRNGFGGRLNLEQQVVQAACIAALRPPEAPEASAPDQPANHDIPVHVITAAAMRPAHPCVAGFQETGEASLDGARLVVSGGRGMAGEEGFQLLRELAQKLDGALGGSLPAVDAGWASVSRQVGQSGKYVTPAIYIAVGISGTPQHLAGIDPHTKIIAINKDAEAPIFQVARVGVVAQWEDFLPALLQAIESEGAALSG